MITANTGHVMTVANSIIGVGILAMPFCFQKCGIILSILLLIINNVITRISCHYLIKASMLTRRKSFEFLAFHAFGSSGKLMVELCIIGYLIGTCIAYFVVVGDLGPQIAAKILNITENDRLRTWVMVTVTVLCIIPLGMLKNVDSLAVVCTASIGFYLCLVVKVIAESKSHIVANDWMQNIEYWKPSGTLQCLPIFGMALSCQMQLFEVFETVTNASLEKMNQIVKSATMICMWVYIFMGVFGYMAFCTQPFAGNILVNFSPSLVSDAIKMGFVLSVAFSFPLVIFPCRASIYSLLYRRGHADTTGYIPELRFKTITISIVLLSLSIALLIPSIELVIGLVGSTIGVATCVMFPASCFIKVSKKNSTEKRLAQVILVGGFCLMILGTYANLLAIDENRSGPIAVIDDAKLIGKITSSEKLSENLKSTELHQAEKPIELNVPKISDEKNIDIKQNEGKNSENSKDIKLAFPTKEEIQIVNAESTNKPEEKPKLHLSKLKEITANQNGVDINKDAIKKDEDIAAEEAQKRTKELNKAEVELIKTKELLEKEVDELKQQLKQQNEETKNLVVKKLENIVEKVEQIEHDVYKETQHAELSKNDKDMKQPKDVIAIDGQDMIISKQLNSKDKEHNKTDGNIKSSKDEIAVHPHIPKGPLINMLTDNLKDNKKPIEHNKIAFEPMSYKTGEIIAKIQKSKTIESMSPLPLPLLINSSIPKQQEANKQEEAVRQTESPAHIKPKEEVPEVNNIESIRRDILQANAEKEPITEVVLESRREKRNVARDSCINWDKQLEDCLDKKTIESLLPHGIRNLEIESIGRDLKSFKERN